MVNCAACNKTIRGNQLMKCTKCDYQYHPLCVNISEYRKITEITRSTWICPQCRCATPKTDNTNKPIRSPVCNEDIDSCSPVVVESPSLAANSCQLSLLASEIKLLREDVGELKAHLKSLTDHLMQCNIRLDDYKIKLSRAEDKTRALEKNESEVLRLNSTIEQLNQEINTQAQIHLKNEVEITGITETTNEIR
ncbi:unnamed protein product [Parnassius mnemosyne]|uniref:PHD-type domain-containing protein n=1 Tax=Parnassius mnemosyne TaxID=213953 RepID=A0AAV1KCP9_9NEOP